MAGKFNMMTLVNEGELYRLRQRYGQLIRLEIEETVADSTDVDEELRHLLSVIGPWETKQS